MAVRVQERNGAVWVYVNYKGIRKAKSIGPADSASRAAAKVVARTVEAQIALGDLTFLRARPDAPTTLTAYAERWLATAVKGRLKIGSYEFYERTMRHHWLPQLGSYALTAITREPIKAQLGTWLAAGARTSTVEGRLRALSACLMSAVEDGLIVANPATRLGKWARRTEERAERVSIFTREELRAVIEGAKPQWQPLLLCMARTGLRIGEVLTLQWDDLDTVQRFLHVRRTWGSRKAKVINSPKGNRERQVDVSAQLLERLTAHRDKLQVEALVAGRELGPWMFPTETGEPMTPSAFWHRVWQPSLKAAGVPHRHPHTTRHTFASMLLAQGESLAYVRDQLGHASISLTVNLYGHLVPGANRGAVDRLDDVKVAVGQA